MALLNPKPGERPGGRKKGTPNKLTTEVKDALSKCFKSIGGHKAFSEWARGNPTEFYKLWSKLLPKELELSGVNGSAIELAVTVIEVAQSEPSTHDDDSPTPERQSLNGAAAH